MKKSESDINPSFFDLVHEVVKQIPYGRVTSYGAIANFLGSKRSSRMVGWAMNASHHLPEQIPAHRVVNRNGMLTGKYHFDSPDLMEQLLINEGAVIENDRIVNFREIFWEPLPEQEGKIKD
jgi:methylated-DNA-protein-cysteine methyltransferase-like protein